MSTRLKNKLAAASDQVKEAYTNGATLREIGDIYGVSAGTVRNKLIELGVNLRSRGRRKNASDEPQTLPVENLTDRVENAESDPTPAVNIVNV